MPNYCGECGTSLIQNREPARRAIDKLRRSKKKTRKASPAQKRYGREFKRLAPKYKKKAGGWKKDGFKNCAKAARRAAKK